MAATPPQRPNPLARPYSFARVAHKPAAGVGMKKNFSPSDVEAGRAYSSAYVEFVHYAERLYEAAETMAPVAHKH